MRVALAVNILEVILTGQILQAADDAGHAPVSHVEFMELAALASEGEAQRRAINVHMIVLKGRQAIRPIADAHQRFVEQAHHGRQGLVMRTSRPAEIAGDALPDGRQRPREVGLAREPGFVAHHAPGRVIAILLAATGIAADRLKVSARVRVDPDGVPGRWHGNGANAPQGSGIPDRHARGVEIAPASLAPAPRHARLAVGGRTRASGAGRGDGGMACLIHGRSSGRPGLASS